MPTKLTTLDFLERAREIHGNEFDYSDVIFVNSHTKVVIKCRIHGSFEQKPSKHWSGQGCKLCSRKKNSERRKEQTKKLFKSKAKKVHSNLYVYNLDNLVSYDSVISITCSKHGDFNQKANVHLRGSGCQKCARLNTASARRKTIDQFIQDAKEVHGHRYDYSRVNYVNSHTNVSIICKIHGEFEQQPSNHLMGKNCSKCSRRYQRSIEEFVQEANDLHNNKYDYSKSIWINTQTKLTITCPEHGDFQQVPNKHLQPQGCPKCATSFPLDTKEWIRRARELHGSYYDYSKVKYMGKEAKVEIICPKHGTFWQGANVHLRTSKSTGAPSGCSDCSGYGPITTEQWINDCKKIHGDKYDYSLVEYVNPQTRVEIICPVHGSFLQLPTVHRQSGSGCSSCAKFGIDRDAPTFIYAMEIIGPEGRWWWKGGVSIDPHRRAMQIERSMKNMGLNLHINVIDIVEIESGREAEKIETAMKEEENIREYTIEKFDGSTELFSSNPIKWAIDRGLINQKY